MTTLIQLSEKEATDLIKASDPTRYLALRFGSGLCLDVELSPWAVELLAKWRASDAEGF